MKTHLRVAVLGAAAGGGLPQWNCGCANCQAARAGRIPSLTQSSLAASGDGENWLLLNASPDIGRQLLETPVLYPTGPRRSPIRSVLLTNGDIDHVAGLLTLREKQPFDVWMTDEIARIIAANSIFDALDPTCVARRTVGLGEAFEPTPGVQAELFAVPGKVPLYLEGDEATLETALEGEQTVGVTLRSGGRTMHYVPGCARVTTALAERLDGTDALFFDGTLYEDEEMIRLGLGPKTGRRMGHISMNGPDGSMAALAPLTIGRRIYIHMNNSNPVLDPASAERRAVEAAGWEVATDGMEVRP